MNITGSDGVDGDPKAVTAHVPALKLLGSMVAQSYH